MSTIRALAVVAFAIAVSACGDSSQQTSITLTASSTSVLIGTSVTLTATVQPAAATGSVTFSEGSTSVATVPLTDGTASFVHGALGIGTHTFTARYAGSSTYAPSTSSPITVTVGT